MVDKQKPYTLDDVNKVLREHATDYADKSQRTAAYGERTENRSRVVALCFASMLTAEQGTFVKSPKGPEKAFKLWRADWNSKALAGLDKDQQAAGKALCSAVSAVFTADESAIVAALAPIRDAWIAGRYDETVSVGVSRTLIREHKTVNLGERASDSLKRLLVSKVAKASRLATLKGLLSIMEQVLTADPDINPAVEFVPVAEPEASKMPEALAPAA